MDTQEPDRNRSSEYRTFFDRKSLIRGIAGILITAALVYFLIPSIKLEHFSLLLSSVSPAYLVVATVVYAFVYVLRALRFQLMFREGESRFERILSIVSLHSLFNHILPFRLGELSYLYFQRRFQDVPVEKGGASLLVARVMDLFTILILGILILYWALLPSTTALFSLIILTVFAAIVLGRAFSNRFFAPTSLIREDEEVPQKNMEKLKLTYRILRFLRKLVIQTSCILERTSFVRFFLVSLVIWSFTFLYFYYILLAFGLRITFFQSLIPAFGAILGNILPVNGLGSIGTFETGLVLGQVAIKSKNVTMVSLAFIVHAHVIITALFLSLVSWTYLHYDQRKENRQPGREG